MKKIIILIGLLCLLGANVNGQGLSSDGGDNNLSIEGEINNNDLIGNCYNSGGEPIENNGIYVGCNINGNTYGEYDVIIEGGQSVFCKENNQYKKNGKLLCCPGVVVDSQENPGTKSCIVNNEGTAGINMNTDCLLNGQCSYNIYETLGIRKSDQNPSVGTFVQDIVLAATTFIGTVVAIVLVVSGILYIISAIIGNSALAEKAKKGLFNSILGLILVVTSYAIVRLIQFLATAGGG